MAASTSPTLSPGATLADRYEILSHVRSGVLSEVYRAAVKGVGDRVEVSVLRTAFASAELPKRIERELRRVADLSLRAVPALREVFSDPAGLVVVVDAPPDDADPRSMRERVDAEGAMEPSEVSRVVSEVAGVLDAMHQGLAPPHLHRRINPDTVRTLASGEVQVLECGLGHALVATGVVTPRIPMQSRQYLSPDELLQRPSVRADLFALTSLAFECLTGSVAFQGPTEASLSAAILRGPRPSVCALRDDLPSEVDAVFARGWAQEPSKAFPTATELAEALREVVARRSSPGSAPPPKPVPPRRNPATNTTLKVSGSVPPPLSDSEKAALASPAVPVRAPRPLNPTQKVLVPRIHAPGTERFQDDDDAIIDAAIRTVAPRPDPTDPPPPMQSGAAPRSNPPSDGWVDLDAKGPPRPRAASTSSPPTDDPSGRRRFGTLVSSVPPPPSPTRSREESSPKLNVHAPIPRARASSVPPPFPSDRNTSVPPPLPPSRPSNPVVGAQPTEEDPGDVTFDLSADPDELMPSAPLSRSAPPPPLSKPPVSAAPSAPPSPAPPVASHEMDPEEEVESFELAPSLDASPAEEPVTTPPPEPVTIPIPVPAPVFDPVPAAQPPAPAVDPAAVFTPPAFAPPSAPYAPPPQAEPQAPAAPNVPSWQPVAEPPAPPRKPGVGRRVAVLGGVLIGFAIVAVGAGLYLNRDTRGTNDTPPAPTRLPPRPVVAEADVPVAAEADASAVAAIDASAGDVAVAAALDATVVDDVTAVAAAQDASAAAEDVAVAAGSVDAGEVASVDVPPAERRRHPRRRDMRAMEDALRTEVLTCVGGEHRRRVRVAVTYAGETGQPTAVNVSGIYAEPPIGPCIEGVFRRHPVEPFTEESYEARFTFRRRSHHDDEDEEE